MLLVDRDRRYVAANDAALRLYQRRREEMIGHRASSGKPGQDPALRDAVWEELFSTGELYGEEVVHFAGPPLRVSYAAHATELEGRWMALFVVLSAQLEPHGDELITAAAPAPTSPGKGLTAREREIVQRVALGRSTPQIAADLGLSPATVRSHVRNAMVKAGAHTRAQLVALVLGEGLARG